jgi:hypothetical protein
MAISGKGEGKAKAAAKERRTTGDHRPGIYDQSRLKHTVSTSFERKPGSSQWFGEREYHS